LPISLPKKKKIKMTKKFIQDIIVKKGTSFTPKPEAKVVNLPVAKVVNPPVVKLAEVKTTPPKTAEVVKKTINSVNIAPPDKIEQNPFFKEHVKIPEKENYLPPEWSGETSGNKLKKKIKWLLILFLIGSIFFVAIKLVSVFSTVNITVTPKQKALEIKKDFVAKEQADTESLYFQTAELDYEGTKSVSGSGQEELQQKATGVVALFNTNSKSQFLVKETRLESPDGKIYKTEKSLTIPANGSMEVNVFADKPGKEYNVELTDFKLPGFKGNPKYETVFGRSKTTMTGGYVGQASILSDADFNKAQEELKKEVAQYLKDSIEKNTPAGFLAYQGSVKITFATSTPNPRVGEIGKDFEIKESATAEVYLLKTDELSEKITEAYASQLTPINLQGFKVANLNKLDFVLKSAAEDGKTIEFTIKGPATFVWNTSKDNIINDLRNTSSANYKELLNAHTEIESAEIMFSPSLWKIIPRDESRIKYEEKQPI